ncbi:Crp/Fnr family transcriptional regulator [Formosa sp. 3Alg 14/1]|uniref:Crp/Fnr family transcriptional regulator n=1 Tax=unclassified Formosa TaxID=2644710 RepID=UPI0039BE0806
MYASLAQHVRDIINPSEHDMAYFLSTLNEVSLQKGAFLLQPGVVVNQEYFVVSGCLKAYYMDARGNKHILQFAIENWWIGDFEAFYNQSASKLYIEAIEDAKLLSLSYKALQSVYSEAPIFERYFRVLVTKAFISQQKRILSTQEKNTQERYLEFCDAYPTIQNRIANYDIANYLGVTAENLSRVRNTLKKLKIS